MLQPGVAASPGKGNCSQVHKPWALDAAQALRCEPCVLSLRTLHQEETEMGQRLSVAALSQQCCPGTCPVCTQRCSRLPQAQAKWQSPSPPPASPSPHGVTTGGVKPERHYRSTEVMEAQQEQEHNQHFNWLFPQNQGRRLKKTPNQPNLNGKDLTESFLIFMKLNAEAFTMS